MTAAKFLTHLSHEPSNAGYGLLLQLYSTRTKNLISLSLSLIFQFSFLKLVAFDYRQCSARVVLLRLMRMECAHFLPTLLLMVLVSSQAHWEYSHYGKQQTQQVRDLCFPFDLLWRVWVNICQHTTVCLLPFFVKFQGCGSPWSLKWSEVKITQSCLILCNPMKYTVHGIL